MHIDSGDTAWVLASSALVLLMTPGLALFYGGMVHRRSVLNMIMMSFGALSVVTVLWVLYGYSVAFGDDVGGGLLGDPAQFLGLGGLLAPDAAVGTVPALAFVAFQGAFAVITVALVSGAVADRARFCAWLLFAGGWATFGYFPVAHWVFAYDGGTAPHGGWIANRLGAIDFAGGTAVHVNAGAAALALALVVGPRLGFGQRRARPHNMTLVMLGTGLLWFGWFGFNAGSAAAADQTASAAWVDTLVAAAAGSLAWTAVERVRDGHPTSLGAASGVVAGLVAITPACSALSPLGAIGLGAVAGACCSWAIGLKDRLGYDDSLDVVGVHLVGGLVGTLGVGLLATSAAPAGVDGLLYGGGLDQLWRQAAGTAAVAAYSFTTAWLLGTLVDKTVGFRVPADAEARGIDAAVHAETAYDLGVPAPVYRAGGLPVAVTFSSPLVEVRDATPR